jgi:hypothetical protein
MRKYDVFAFISVNAICPEHNLPSSHQNGRLYAHEYRLTPPKFSIFSFPCRVKWLMCAIASPTANHRWPGGKSPQSLARIAQVIFEAIS